MAANRNEQRLLEAMWLRVQPLLPPRPVHTKGGRPFADDFRCFAGIVYLLRNGGRWNDLPREYPSDTTCWRRFDAWSKAGVWKQIHEVVVSELQEAGLLDFSELAIDATFAEARKGGPASGPQNAGSATRSRC
jgi:transposase